MKKYRRQVAMTYTGFAFSIRCAWLLQRLRFEKGRASMMFKVATIAAVALACVNCSEPGGPFAYGVPSNDEPADTQGAASESSEAKSAELPTMDSASTSSFREASTLKTFRASLDRALAFLVVSSVEAPDGSMYGTGVFYGTLDLVSGALTSHGDADVFLIKINSDKSFGWARVIGSPQEDGVSRVSLTKSGRVVLLGTTDGDVDCGLGPLAGWSSGTFFVCTFSTEDGAFIEGGAFPTGTP